MNRKLILAAFVGLLAMAYAATGIVVVAPGEVAVVRRMGRVLSPPWAQGPHWGLPRGFDRVDRVRIDEVRRLPIGRKAGRPDADEFLTGDLNLARAEGVVQYRIADPAAFVLRAREAERILEDVAGASLTRSLAHVGIDDILQARRAEVADEVMGELSRACHRLGLGISILGVSLTQVRPPSEVAADFEAAQAAGSTRDRRIQEARSRASLILPAARAEARTRTDRAAAEARRTAALARSRADRFLLLLAEARRSRALTVRRLYRETLRDVLEKPRRKLVLGPDEPIDLSIFEK